MTNMVINTSLTNGASVPAISESLSAKYTSGQTISQLLSLGPNQQFPATVGFSLLSLTPSGPVQLLATKGSNTSYINQTVNQQLTIDDTVDLFSVLNTSATNTVTVRLVYTVYTGSAPPQPSIVTSVNGLTGAVVLTASNITGFATVATTGSYNDLLNKPTIPGPYTLPVATTTVLGGVKQGTNITIASDGTISSAAGYVLPPATTSTLGGVIIGSGLEVQTNGTLSVTALGGVTSFNLRTGDITLQTSDITGAGGAPIASPAFTGAPTAPTPTTGDNSTNIATTAFVTTALSNLNAGAVAVFEFVATQGQTSFPATIPVGALVEAFQDGVILLSSNYSYGTTGPFVLNTGATAGDEIKLIVTSTLQIPDVVPISGGTYSGEVFGITAAPGDNSAQFATTAFVTAAVAAVSGVASFNSRTGAVTLQLADVTGVGGAPTVSPAFTGIPTAPTATAGTNTTQLATTAFVTAAVAAAGGVASFNTRTGAVTLVLADVTGVGGAPLASPAFTGTPTVPTATAGTNTTQAASTAFVATAVTGLAPLASPTFTGVPAGPTAAPGTNTTQLATTAFVTAAVASSGVTSFNTRSGAVTLQAADVTGVGGALLASPTFTGTPKAPTPTAGDSTTNIATTAFVATSFAPLASPTFTGTPAAPTPTAGTNTTQIATTAFVTAAVAAAGGVTTFNTRSGAVTLQAADVTGVGGALLASPTFTGVPAAPTATAGTNTTQIATTAFVATSFAPLASPALTGTPTAPTATAGTNTTQIATTAFVTAAVAAGVISFNSRTGAVTLQAADVTGVGGALLASPTFTGTPAAPTAAGGTNTTQIATTAFVYAATQGETSIPLTNANVTLSAAQYSNPIIKLTGTLTGAVQLTLPTTGLWTFYNATTGAFTITLTNGAGANLVLASGTTPAISDATAGIVSATSGGGAVTSVAGRTGAVTLAVGDVSGAAPLASPTFTGTPAAPTATAGTNTTQIATTAFVASNFAALTGATFSGTVQISDSSPVMIFNATSGTTYGTVNFGVSGVTSWQLQATSTSFAIARYSGGTFVDSPLVINLSTGAITIADGLAGTPTAPTPTAGDNSTKIATTAFVATSFAPLASPALTGTPTAPTASGGTNNTQIATTGYVYSATQGETSIALTNANVTLSAAQYSNPIIKLTGTLTGAVQLTMPTTGRWDFYNATTGAFAITLTNGTGANYVIGQGTNTVISDATAGILSGTTTGGAVTSVATRTGAITLAVADVSGAAPLASPTFTGTPAAPTPTAGDNSTKVATTAFVATSFAPLASPSFTGRVQAPAASYTVTALGSISGTQTLDLATASEWTMTITGATTIAFTNTLGANLSEVIYLRFTNAGSAAITWPASTKFAGGAAPTFTASGVDLVGVKYDTTTSTYMVFVVGLAVA